jgi:hypothetical protein
MFVGQYTGCWGVFDTTLREKVVQWLAAGRWFSPGTPSFSPNKTDRHDITEILLKVALNAINLVNIQAVGYSTLTPSGGHSPFGQLYKHQSKPILICLPCHILLVLFIMLYQLNKIESSLSNL